jgi:K+/H+ antiporter YhaU regulatory subunit KhtT
MNAQISVVIDEIKKKELLLNSIQNDTNQAAIIQSTKEEIARLKSILSDFTKQLDKLNKALKEQK